MDTIILSFSEITLDALPKIRNIVDKANCQSSVYSCYNLYGLREKYNTRYAIYDNTLFIRRLAGEFDDYAVFLCPVGSMDMKHAVSLIKENALAIGKRAFFFGVTDEQLQFFGSGFKTKENRDWADYIYSVSSIAALSGAGLRRKRQEFNKFKRAYADFVWEEICDRNICEAIDFQLSRYKANKDANGNNPSLEMEHKGIMTGFQAWEQLHMHGVLIRINGQIAAYNIGTSLNGSMFVSHAQKADKSFTKIYSAITKMFSISICEKYELLNLEEDLGLLGLRLAKLHYKPCKLLMKYNVMEMDSVE